MRILWLSPSDMNTEPVITGLDTLVGHDIEICRYDRIGIPVDRGMLDAADRIRPNLILYIGQNGGPFLASMDTFVRLRAIAPTVFLLFDGSDTTWKPLLHEYRVNGVFSLTVNIDGNDEWEKSGNDFTALTPTNPEFYREQLAIGERPIHFGFAGGFASPSRREIVEYLVRYAGLQIPVRNENYGSYQRYADFMISTRIVLNVPFSGSDNSHQVKGRVVEAGMAGCVLLEHAQSASARWFTPHLDYVTYGTLEEAANIIPYMLKHEDDMAMLAMRLRMKVMREHSPAVFWPRVFEKALA